MIINKSSHFTPIFPTVFLTPLRIAIKDRKRKSPRDRIGLEGHRAIREGEVVQDRRLQDEGVGLAEVDGRCWRPGGRRLFWILPRPVFFLEEHNLHLGFIIWKKWNELKEKAWDSAKDGIEADLTSNDDHNGDVTSQNVNVDRP